MRLKRLNVAGFGKLKPGLKLEFAPGFNLLLAPNEAGKTTTLELVTALLYGFGKRAGGVHPYEPWSGGADETGAELIYELDDGREFRLSRHLKKRGENLALREAAGTELELNGLEPGQLHLGLSKGVFHTVSRVQLNDLEGAFSGANPKEIKDARQELLGYFFMEAATRGEVRNPVEVSEAWATQAAGLYHSHGNRGRADRDLNQQLGQAENDLAQARQREEQARQTQAELEALDNQQIELNERRNEAAKALDRAQAALTRAREVARKTALQAEIAELVAQGLADESSEQRARDLEREAAAAEERRRQALTRAARERAKAGEGDAAQELGKLNALEARLTALKAREQETAAQKDALGRKWLGLEQEWAMELESLAGLAEDLPLRLHELAQAAGRAQDESSAAFRKIETLPPPPSWALGLGLGVVAGLVGIKGLVWSYLASWPWWAWAGAGLLLAAGLGLGISALVKRGQGKAIALQAERLAREAKAAADRAAGLESELAQISMGLSAKALSAGPGRLSAAMAEAAGLLEQAEKQSMALSALSAEREELARELAETAGQAVSGDWQEAVNQAREAGQARMQAGKEAGRLEREAAQEQDRVQARRKDLSQLLADSGLADLEALKQARNRARRVDQLGAKLAEVEDRLGKMPPNGIGSGEQDACQAALEKAHTEMQSVQAQLSGLSQKRGRLEQELRQLNQSKSAAQAEAVLEELGRRRGELVRRHGVLLLAGACLEKAMQRFRLEAQPSLLQRASEFLSKTSAGAYEWLGSNIFDQKPGQDPGLTARSGPGAMDRQAQVLSRGTRDQLYLCLRLALAQEITGGGEPVPLLLDDPLVNFDDQRLAATFAMLYELAKGRQLLLLTCHRTQYELARGMGSCNLLDLT
jgi:uncharacterized protein YhaN